MNYLDVRTVILSYSISNLICMIVMAGLWYQNRKRFAGMGLWLADFVLQFGALMLISMRGVVPDLLSMTGSNVMVVGGTILLFMGLERFVDRRGPTTYNYIFLAVFAVVHGYFAVVLPNLLVRNIVFSVGVAWITAQGAWLMLRRVGAEMVPITRGVGNMLAGFCLISVGRIFIDLAMPPAGDFFHSNVYATLILMTYQALFILLTFSIFLMVNRRLVANLEEDIKARKNAEDALRLSEEKFFKAFQSSPDAILITRISDGQLIEVNEGFTKMTGYSRDEALSATTISLGLWPDLKDRERLIDELRRNRVVHDYECGFRIKSGEIINSLCSGEVFELSGEEHVLSVVRDVTERKRVENLLKLRVYLIEYAETNPLGGLIQKSLDEICDITGSLVGFYHLVEEDQKTLTLQAWSTRTLTEFCKAEGRGMHYSVDKAGVWVDCVRERRPIIHNDYASLPNRKGLPQGHAEVVRELVVPILRNGLVVSVLGVGNKAADYNENDINLVSYIADIIWGIVERKKTHEALRERVKELNCFFEISKLLIDSDNSFEAIVEKTVNIIPQSWKYSDITCSRITIEGKTYKTSNFLETPWRLISYIKFQGNKIGAIEVCYLEEKEQSHEGPFLLEERALINGIGELLSIAFERKRAEEKLKILKKAMDTIEIGVTISDRNGNITYTNPAEARMHGYDVAELIGRHSSIFGLNKPSKTDPAADIDNMVHWKRESVNVSADGSSFPVQLVSTPVKDESEKAIGIVTISEDITERKRIEEQLKQLASTDPLTGCYNRRYFFELGENELKRSKRYGHVFSVLMMDIDHFKKINDEYGHAVGDATLVALAKTCLSSIRATDVFGRLGGEEFGIVFVETNLSDSIVLAERIRSELSEILVPVEKDVIGFTVSIGLSEIRQDDISLDEILKRADQALYEAKNEGRNRVKVCRSLFG